MALFLRRDRRIKTPRPHPVDYHPTVAAEAKAVLLPDLLLRISPTRAAVAAG